LEAEDFETINLYPNLLASLSKNRIKTLWKFPI